MAGRPRRLPVAALRSGTAPCAALVSYEDIYVERAFSEETAAVLADVAWRVQRMQHYPEIVSTLYPWAREPYYANSDDQTLLNDAIVSAVTGNQTFAGSTARYEARNRYNPAGPPWEAVAEANEWKRLMSRLYKRQRWRTVK